TSRPVMATETKRAPAIRILQGLAEIESDRDPERKFHYPPCSSTIDRARLRRGKALSRSSLNPNRERMVQGHRNLNNKPLPPPFRPIRPHCELRQRSGLAVLSTD